MCSSRPNPTEPRLRPDVADRVGSVVSAGCLVVLSGAAGLWLHTRLPAPPPGEIQLSRETHLRIELAPMPEVSPPLAEPVVEKEPLPEPLPVPEPLPIPVLKPAPPEPMPEPEEPPPPVEAAPMPAAQTPMEEEGAKGREAAIRAEWMTQLRRRIEQSKFYPGAARYSRETGTVLLRIEIEASATIGAVQLLDNSGSALLAEGALAIVKRASETPLGTNELSSGFQVEVPITYQVGRR